MFERYTEKARRVIFFARYEASQLGSPYIETEHLLLGVLREDKPLTNRLVGSHSSVESIRKQIDEHTTVREKVSTSVDLPLSDESKRVLAYAAEEAEKLSDKSIGTEHLFLGLLREKKCFASEILIQRGITLAETRGKIAHIPRATSRQQKDNPLDEFGRDLTQAALDNHLEPTVGREKEIKEIVEVLCSYIKRNPMLIDDEGMDGGAVVELLAQLIANGDVPEFLGGKRLWALEFARIFGGAAYKEMSINRLSTIVNALIENPDSIIFIDDIQGFMEQDVTGVFRTAVLKGEIQCIGATTAADYEQAVKISPWLSRCFRDIMVSPMSASDITRTLFARKIALERFHGVSYEDGTIEYAVRLSPLYFRGEAVLEKAMQLLDAAGTRVKLRTTMPEEVVEAQKRIKFIAHRMESAIANHEFEKAKFYSDEERKERENLRVSQDKYHVADASAGVVTGEDIEDVVSSWTGIPLESIKKGLTG